MRQTAYLLRSKQSPLGSADWLVQCEIKYGGYITNLPKKKASPADSAKTGFLTGGDRMLAHGYSEVYSRYLRRFLNSRERLTVVEIGILRGTGLAMWCDLFKNARVIGLDIDLSNFRENLETLEKRGAFEQNRPEVFEFDQFQDNTACLEGILQGGRIDVVIDDGCHADEAIVTTMRSVVPHLKENFIYFVEDNDSVHRRIESTYPEYRVDSQGDLTVVSRR